MTKKSALHSVIIILTFLFAFYGNRILGSFIPISFESSYLRLFYFYSWWIIPPVFVAGILFGFKELYKTFGLSKGFVFGFVFAFITVLPMLISSAVMGEVRSDFNFFALLNSSLFPGLIEEFLFRGFLFGILFNKLEWGFIPAALLGALIFGLAHIYQGSSIPETFGIFLMTAIGAVWFAWLYIEWDNNLWVPIFLHILMNLSWSLFEVSDNALGGFSGNIFRAITIGLTVYLTIRHSKKNGPKVNKGNLWVRTSE